MTKIEMNQVLLDTYRLSFENEDNFGAVMTLFQEKPNWLREVLYRWFEYELKTFLYLRGANMPFPFGEQLIILGKLTPNLFARLVRASFEPPQTSLKEGDEGYVKEFTDEEEIALQQAWLKTNLPEIFEDIQAEMASADSQKNSVTGKLEGQKFVEGFISRLMELPDPKDTDPESK